MYEKITDNIWIGVEPNFLDEQSSPEDSRYVWSYKVKIRNQGEQSVQLRSRHWRITDANGFMQEVKGDGVVGDQPVLKPGDAYEYTSGAPLATPSGFMMGDYTMERPDGKHFKVDIPAFSLDSPHQNIVLN